MTSSNIIRWGAIAAMLGGVFWVVWSLLGRVSFEAAGSPFADLMLLLATLLTLGGLVGLHVLQGGNYGRIGRAGFYAAAVGLLVQALAALLLLMGSDAWEVTLQWLVAPVGSLIVLVGLVLYGAATLQARVLARWFCAPRSASTTSGTRALRCYSAVTSTPSTSRNFLVMLP
jgi:hypothetical protein